MNKKLTSWLFTSILLTTPISLQAQYHSQVWNPDNGNGTYTNPVIYADYSDPDVVAVGDDYYLTAIDLEANRDGHHSILPSHLSRHLSPDESQGWEMPVCLQFRRQALQGCRRSLYSAPGQMDRSQDGICE